VFSVKQRHIDTTEAWAPDARVTVVANFADIPQIISPATNSTVPLGHWIEGIGMPGTELRFVEERVDTTIYAQGMVNADGCWRVQFKPEFPAGTYPFRAALYKEGVRVSDWLVPLHVLTFVAKS
jgi:hypothetical protein